jgi:glycosyltransferase involved in cell wall biosynthesis
MFSYCITLAILINLVLMKQMYNDALMKPEKRVLFIEFTPYFGSVNGLITQLNYMNTHKTHWRPIVICAPDSVLLKHAHQWQIPIYTCEASHLFDFPKAPFKTIATYLKALSYCLFIAIKHRVHLIHCYHYMWSTYATPVGFLLHRPVIVHLKDVWLLKPKLSRIIMKFYSKTTYIAVSEYVKRLFSTKYNVNASKIVTIFDGVSSNVLTSPSKEAIVKKAAQKKKRIVLFSRLDPERDVEIFIDTAAIIVKEFPHITFHHYGYLKGKFDEHYVKTLKDRVKHLGITKNFFFEPYLPSFEAVNAAYREAFLSVVPARRFALSNAIIESMLCGVPSVALDIDGNPEIIDSGKTGLLVPTKSPVFFANAVRTYVLNSKLYVQTALRARTSATQRFDADPLTKKILSLYEKLT